MKRTELEVGQTYETAQGETIIVMFLAPYVRSGSPYSVSRRCEPCRDGKGSGVAVALRVGSVWYPEVRYLSQIQPFGTEQAKRNARRAEADRINAVYSTQRSRCQMLASQLGVSDYAITWSGLHGYRVDGTFIEAVERVLRHP